MRDPAAGRPTWRDRALRRRTAMTLPRELRDDFPLLARRREIVYLDSAATSQKPRAMLDAMRRFYETSNANVRRGVHRLGEEATEALGQARGAVRGFLRSRLAIEVFFSGGMTESIWRVGEGGVAGRLVGGGGSVLRRRARSPHM